jgi:hypothetical protein
MRGPLIHVSNVKRDKLLRNISMTNRSAGDKKELMDMILKGRIREDMKCHMF